MRDIRENENGLEQATIGQIPMEDDSSHDVPTSTDFREVPSSRQIIPENDEDIIEVREFPGDDDRDEDGSERVRNTANVVSPHPAYESQSREQQNGERSRRIRSVSEDEPYTLESETFDYDQIQDEVLLAEEETRMQLLADESRAREADFWARLDDQMQVFRDVYSISDGNHAGSNGSYRVWFRGSDEEENAEFFLPDEILRDDAQIEDLVARCETRDRDIMSQRNATSYDNQSTVRKKGEQKCVICLDAARTHAFVPCGHLCVCQSCAREHGRHIGMRSSDRLRGAPSCPICQQPSTLILRIYVP